MADDITPPPAGGAPAGSPPPGAGSPPPAPTDWRNFIKDPAIRAHQTFSQMKEATPEDAINSLASQYFNAQKTFGAEKVERPQPTWTKEQMAEWRQKTFNLPMNAQEYTYDNPKYKDMIDPKVLDTFKGLFHRAGTTPQQAQEILDGYYDWAQTSVQAHQAAQQEAAKNRQLALQKEWGNNEESNRQMVEYAAKKLGIPGLEEKVKADPYDQVTNNLLLKVAKMTADSDPAFMRTGEGANGKPALDLGEPVQISNRISEIYRDPIVTEVLKAGGLAPLRSQYAAKGRGSIFSIEEAYNAKMQELNALYEQRAKVAK